MLADNPGQGLPGVQWPARYGWLSGGLLTVRPNNFIFHLYYLFPLPSLPRRTKPDPYSDPPDNPQARALAAPTLQVRSPPPRPPHHHCSNSRQRLAAPKSDDHTFEQSR